MSADPSHGKNLPEWQAYQETLPWTTANLGWWDRRLVASDNLIGALLRELEAYQALVENLSGEVERLTHQLEQARTAAPAPAESDYFLDKAQQWVDQNGTTQPCPWCRGHGGVTGYVHKGGHLEEQDADCGFCGGQGWVAQVTLG